MSFDWLTELTPEVRAGFTDDEKAMRKEQEKAASHLSAQLCGCVTRDADGKQIPRMIDSYTVYENDAEGRMISQNVDFYAPRIDTKMAEFVKWISSVFKYSTHATIELRSDGRAVTVRDGTRTMEFERNKIPPRLK